MFRYIYAFDHLAASTGAAETYLGTGSNFRVSNGRLDLVNIGGILHLRNYSTNGSTRYFWLSLMNMGVVFSKRVIIGFRFYSQSALPDVFHIGPIAGYLSRSNALVFGTTTELGRSGYVEVVFDFDALTTTVFVNGAQRKFKQQTQAEMDSIAVRIQGVGTEAAYNPSVGSVEGVYYSDFYVRDSVNESDAIVPLGVVRPTLITVAQATAAGFTPTSGTATSVLNAAVASTATQPTISAPDSLKPAVVEAAMSCAPVAGRVPIGVNLFCTSVGPRAGNARWSSGGVTVDVVGTNFPKYASTQAVSSIGILDRTPDGRTWSWNNINQLSTTLTFP